MSASAALQGAGNKIMQRAELLSVLLVLLGRELWAFFYGPTLIESQKVRDIEQKRIFKMKD